MPLTPKQAAFVVEYLVDLNATQAAIRAGYAKKAAEVEGSRLLRNAKVQAAVSEAKEARSARVEVTADMVLEQWWKIATADPNGIVSHRRVCCRYCHGKGFKYQWKASEYQEAMEVEDRAAKDAGREPQYPSDAGGYGFDAKAPPHHDCPECFGEGSSQVFIEDSRNIKGDAKVLYAGAKQTSQGVEVKLRDQDKALELVAKHLGMFKDEINLGGNVTINVVKRG